MGCWDFEKRSKTVKGNITHTSSTGVSAVGTVCPDLGFTYLKKNAGKQK